MVARSIGSIMFTSMKDGTKLLIKLLLVLRKSRRTVKRSSKQFYRTLRDSGIPEDFAREMTYAYTAPGLQMLKMGSLLKIVQELSEEQPEFKYLE
ncbi:MAG: hypothetical protein ACFFEF_04795 [Candidatus Thorarchaeota archaeon]